jgi:hypothetical protein
MADKTTPRRTADPWADSVRHKEQQGKLRESHDTKKLQSEKDARRRDDRKGRSHEAETKAPRKRG